MAVEPLGTFLVLGRAAQQLDIHVHPALGPELHHLAPQVHVEPVLASSAMPVSAIVAPAIVLCLSRIKVGIRTSTQSGITVTTPQGWHGRRDKPFCAKP